MNKQNQIAHINDAKMFAAESLGKAADDFMEVTIELSFLAKTKPEFEGNDDFDQLSGITEYAFTVPAKEDTAELLEQLAKAIREHGLYGWMQQQRADSACDTGQWIGSTAK